jgi:hypothetical protein
VKVSLLTLSSLAAALVIGIRRHNGFVERTGRARVASASTPKGDSSTSTQGTIRQTGTALERREAMNQNHLLVGFLATLVAVIILAVQGDQNLGGTLQLIDALTGLLLILGGALAGSQVPRG